MTKFQFFAGMTFRTALIATAAFVVIANLPV